MKNIINFRKVGFKPLVCVVAISILLLSSSFAQTFSGGSGTSSDPYKISNTEDLVELSTYVKLDLGPKYPIDVQDMNTYGKHFIMTQDIDMAAVSNFLPIGGSRNANNFPTYFCGNFDGRGFSIKNLTIEHRYAALFGNTMGASIFNLTIDNASISCTGEIGSTASTFVVTAYDSLSMDNCVSLNCTLTGSTSGLFGVCAVGRIDNCHVINAKMEGEYQVGFCSSMGIGGQITNSSVSHSSLMGGSSACGFAGISYGVLSNCFVSNCVLSAERAVCGFVDNAAGEINNCYVQASLSRTKAATDHLCQSIGFIRISGISQGEYGYLPLQVSNCYAACEITNADGLYTYDAAFGAGYEPGASLTFTNCYYLEHPQHLPAFLNNPPSAVIVEKSESVLKAAGIVAHPGSVDNSLNFNQSSPVWKQDFSPYPINRGYPILEWMQPFYYVSTYHAEDLTGASATLHGLTFAEGEGVISERGFQWRVKGTGSWTKVAVTDTAFNISHLLTGLTKNTTYECFAYMKLATKTDTMHGDTVEFTTNDKGINITDYVSTSDGISIYPNPTTGQLTIESAELKIERVEILDILGQCVFTTPNPSKGGESSTSAQFPSFGGAGVVIDVSHLASGAYFVTVYSEGQKITRKFVKE